MRGPRLFRLLASLALIAGALQPMAGAARPAMAWRAQAIRVLHRIALTHDGGSSLLGWSFDGRRILFVRPLPGHAVVGQVPPALWVMDARGRGARVVAPAVVDATFTRDNRSILYTTAPYRGVFRVGADGGTARLLVPADAMPLDQQLGELHASLLADGRLVLVHLGRLVAVQPSRGTVTSLGVLPVGYTHVAVAPTGRRVALVDATGLRVFALPGCARVFSLKSSAENVPGNLSWSPTGAAFAYTLGGPGGALYTRGANGESPHRLARLGLESAGGFSWSPDGQALTFTHIPTGTAVTEYSTLAVVNRDGTGLHRIDQGAPAAEMPGRPGVVAAAWSPDGTRIAFTRITGNISSGPGQSNVWVMVLAH